ncbi:PDDEXK nuclease domain-containing protein [Prevotella sp.]|uniref:PDDEXK nuclease domain-containing protein n=1 Tax=Prevotella sp. TaxID=59823 RepID=UPI0025FECC69|nr:PDDEXK nuclease domain-containing protein [Prevotella sp.]MCI6860811.1 PDDEXK nuclease domain-containing protein [Prevotella sp.]MCI7371144.1 PDDEXK nuclease domain-containing protein [Prevotella sp.]MDY4159999.1 PDDEXK nuclease domain-containing protein [Prevotella sp.]
MKTVEQTEGATSLMKYKEEFETICSIIATHRKRVIRVVNNESMSMVWEVGGYVSHKLKTSAWGDGVVRQLSDYIRTKYPAARGWSYRTLYKMVQLYDTYTTASFSALIEETDMTKYGDIVPFETAQIDGKLIVPFEMAQIPNVLFATGWTNHQIILNRCKSDTERLFYMLYAGKEHLENKELLRTIKTDTINSLLGGKDVQSEVMTKTYPTSPLLFKDKVYLEMLGLPLEYKESKLRKEIIAHMKDFILEMGKDFLFIDDEHRVTVGSKTFKVDLLFYHRLLQCMIAIELKTTEFHPKDLGQLEFYLEALDQEERRSNENPSIGIILCKEADMEVVRYALNRSMSPTMVALYKEQLQVGSVIQRSLVEFCKFLKK